MNELEQVNPFLTYKEFKDFLINKIGKTTFENQIEKNIKTNILEKAKDIITEELISNNQEAYVLFEIYTGHGHLIVIGKDELDVLKSHCAKNNYKAINMFHIVKEYSH